MLKSKISFLSLLTVALLWSCTDSAVTKPVNNEKEPVGRISKEILAADYQKIVYTDVNNGNDTTGTGDKENPYRTINHALDNISEAKKGNKIALFVSGGLYQEGTVTMVPWVDLFGGFTSEWERDIFSNSTVLMAKSGKRILRGADNAVVDGFTFADASYRGKGAAIFCDGTSPVITNNYFTRNMTLKPENWNPKHWHETANDGGAIYYRNGASPIITNNEFVQNYTENGRGAAIACAVNCTSEISYNVFVGNVAGLDDPMRSSDGGAVSIFDWCKADVINNYFLSNTAKSKNDAGGIFIALWSSVNLTDNVFVDSEAGDDAGAIFVGGQEHRYDAPLDPLPSKDEFYVTISNNTIIGNRNSSGNSGAMRFTMESRGVFSNNVTAHNNGIYFQRSEVAVKNNIMLDNFLFIETKEGLELGSITDNIIWGEYDQQVEANVSGNYVRGEIEQDFNFVNDGGIHEVVSWTVRPKKKITDIMIADSKYATNELAGRVVKSGSNWGIVKSNEGNTITVWGKLDNSIQLNILPTYTLVK